MAENVLDPADTRCSVFNGTGVCGELAVVLVTYIGQGSQRRRRSDPNHDPNVWSVAYCEKHQPISERVKDVRRIVRQLRAPKETHG